MKSFYRRTLLGLFVATSLLSGTHATAQTPPARVSVIAALHGLHATNPAFSYETLYETVEGLQPDFVGVEIRPEDMAQSDTYLSRQYPREMIHLLRTYGDRSFGFDWLGEELEGRSIPESFWRDESRIVQLQRSQDNELPMTPQRQILKDRHEALGTAQMKIAASASPHGLADGRYAVFDEMTEGTDWSPLAAFYRKRDAMIAQNALAFIAPIRASESYW